MAVAADGHQSEGGRRAFRFHPRVVPDDFQNRTKQHVQHGGVGLADFAPAGAGTVEDFEPVRFDLEEVFVAGKFLRGLAIGWEGKRSAALAAIFSNNVGIGAS